ncbi:MAG: transporter substrate-binding domain-containing protein [Alphaproteobacteria bacterium]|nr:transporter substrate-binding domain-containing protein [Alphaproteobacteria bacterium]
MNRRDFLNFAASAGIAVGVGAAMADKAPQETKADKIAAERILDTRRMRCSYITYAPFIMKDPNTGKLSGMFYDLTQKVGELADFEMEWIEETSFATFPEDLRMSKFDLFAGGLWPEAKQAKVVNYSLPAFYSGLGIYVRGGDHRFDGDAAKLNDAHFRIATIDGEMSQIVQKSDFPKASVLGLPNNADISMLAESVTTRKADATIIEKAVADLYLKRNPGSLRNLTNAKPIRIFGNTWAFGYGAPQLKTVIDTAVDDMLFSGYVDEILAVYEPEQGSFYRVRSPVAN